MIYTNICITTALLSTIATAYAMPTLPTIPTDIHIEGLEPFNQAIGQINTTLNSIYHFPCQIGVIIIGVGTFSAGKHYFSKKDKLTDFKDYMFSFGLMAMGALAVIFSARIAQWAHPKVISV